MNVNCCLWTENRVSNASNEDEKRPAQKKHQATGKDDIEHEWPCKIHSYAARIEWSGTTGRGTKGMRSGAEKNGHIPKYMTARTENEQQHRTKKKNNKW